MVVVSGVVLVSVGLVDVTVVMVTLGPAREVLQLLNSIANIFWNCNKNILKEIAYFLQSHCQRHTR